MPKLRIAINGLGRIGRLILKRFLTISRVQIVAINDPANLTHLTHLLNYDANYGHIKLPHVFKINQDQLVYGKQKIILTQFTKPLNCLWKTFNCDLVVEASGRFTTPAKLSDHLKAGAKRVLLTTNFNDLPIDQLGRTLIYNFNHEQFLPNNRIIALGSCTTNCMLLTLQALSKIVQFNQVQIQTIHALTNQQPALDRLHENYSLSRGIFNNIIPTSSHAQNIGAWFFPDLKLQVSSYRVPVTTGSLLIFNLLLVKPISSITQFHQELNQHTNGSWKLSQQPLTARDVVIKGDTAILDCSLTQSLPNLLKIAVWYDNEWGYVEQIARFVTYLTNHGIK